MLKHLFIFLVLSLLTIGQIVAQSRTVKGKVTEADTNEGIPGVSVSVKGTTSGTTSDIEGNFELAVPEGAVLIFQGVGLALQEVAVGSQSILAVSMKSESKQLGEVVVVGYGVQDKRDLTGSITSIKGGDIANLATASFDQQLGGRAAGVQVNVGSGVIGQAPRIRIRGTNSISANASPLIVIDNVPMITGDNTSGTAAANALADLNPNDIESYEVLKDGAATAIYGSRAANGVILVTTKRGKKGRVKVTYDTWLAATSVYRKFDLLNTQQFVDINNEKINSANSFKVGNGETYDWQNEIFKTGIQQNHSVSISGANDATSYFFSGGYTDINSHVVSNKMKRISFRGNFDTKVNKYLNVGGSLGLTRTENTGLNTGRNSLSGNIFSAIKMYPNVNPRNPNDVTGYSIDNINRQVLDRGPNALLIDNNLPNIAFTLANNINNASSYRVLGNAYAEFQIPQIEGLKLRTQYSVDVLLNTNFTSWDPRHGDGGGARGGLALQGNDNVTRWNWQNVLSYDRLFNNVHRVNVTAGIEYQSTKVSTFNAQATALAGGFFGQSNLVSGTFTTPTITGGATPTGFDSRFVRLSYGFKNRYLASFSVRNDGLSSLPENNRRGTFMGGSLAWRISEEDFFKNTSALSFISDLKIRGSYGEVGNDGIGAFPYLSLLGAAQYGSQNGVSFNQNGIAGNSDLKWEKSAKTDIGVDLELFKGRIGVTFDYYSNNVTNLVLNAPTPVSMGIPGNAIAKNVGSLVNSGVELRIMGKVFDPAGSRDKFGWTVDLNFSTNKNQIQSLNAGQDILFPYTINRVDNPVGSLFGVQSGGVNPANGNPLFIRANGQVVQGNTINNTYYNYDPNSPNDFTTPVAFSPSAERVLLGQTNPAWFGGVSNQFTYKGFDFELFLRYSGGNKIMNVTRVELLSLDRVNNGTEILGRWTTPGQITDVPIVRNNFNNNNFVYGGGTITNSRFVESGDFLRIQNITLGYTLSDQAVKALGIARLRMYIQVQNAYVFTKYKGLDPELNANGDTNSQFGIDYNTNPLPRTILFGLNLGF